jgi:hypothetical protein
VASNIGAIILEDEVDDRGLGGSYHSVIRKAWYNMYVHAINESMFSQISSPLLGQIALNFLISSMMQAATGPCVETWPRLVLGTIKRLMLGSLLPLSFTYVR